MTKEEKKKKPAKEPKVTEEKKAKTGKKQKVAKTKIVPQKITAANLEEAVQKLQSHASENKKKFVESVDIAAVLGIDSKQSDQTVRGSISLPHGVGKQIKVVVITADETKKAQALEAGAEIAGFEDVVAKIEAGFVAFDCCIASTDVMPKISKIAKILGPRGLMPSPKNGTVTNDVTKAIKEALAGKANFKNDKAGIVHCMVGKVSFDANALVENIKTVIKSIKDAKPEGAKGKFIKKFYLNSTMGPSIEVTTDSL